MFAGDGDAALGVGLLDGEFDAVAGGDAIGGIRARGGQVHADLDRVAGEDGSAGAGAAGRWCRSY